MSKVFQGKFKLKYKEEEQFKVDQFYQFKKNFSKFHTDWTVCDKEIRSQAIIIK